MWKLNSPKQMIALPSLRLVRESLYPVQHAQHRRIPQTFYCIAIFLILHAWFGPCCVYTQLDRNLQTELEGGHLIEVLG
jgi:hypothetical protein